MKETTAVSTIKAGFENSFAVKSLKKRDRMMQKEPRHNRQLSCIMQGWHRICYKLNPMFRPRLWKIQSEKMYRNMGMLPLLQANYDIRTIQELLGHSDVRTTMIYTHTIKSRAIKESRNPLDL